MNIDAVQAVRKIVLLAAVLLAVPLAEGFEYLQAIGAIPVLLVLP